MTLCTRLKASRLFLAIALGVFVCSETYALDRFGAVLPGRVYRAAMPSKADLPEIQTKFKTILFLHHLNKHPLEYLYPLWPKKVQSKAAQEFKHTGTKVQLSESLKLIWIPFDGHTPDVAQFKQALQVALNPENHPLLIHCAYGRHRTGTLTMALRKITDGIWTEPKKYTLSKKGNLVDNEDGFLALSLLELEYGFAFTLKRYWFQSGPRSENIEFIHTLDLSEFKAPDWLAIVHPPQFDQKTVQAELSTDTGFLGKLYADKKLSAERIELGLTDRE